MIRDRMVLAKECTCDVCGFRWLSFATKKPPESCRNLECRSRAWNGQKLRSHRKEIKLPTPRKNKGGRPKTITLVNDEEV